MKKALVLRQSDLKAALAALSRSPKLALGFDASALSAFGDSSPQWAPKPGETLPSKNGDYTVLASRALLPGLRWPWLLCSQPAQSKAGALNAPKAPSGPLRRLSELCLASAGALCLRDGRSRPVLSENGDRLRLISPERLARAVAARPGAAPASTLSSRLGFARAARSRSAPPLRPEISAELASLLRF